MKKTHINIWRFILTTLLVLSLFAGCMKNETKDSKANEQSTVKDTKKDSKPITFTYWVPIHGDAAAKMKNYGESKWAEELEKRTGVHIEYIHPVSGQIEEQFNLLIASGEYPDILEHAKKYKGGADKAIEDGVYLRLNELIEKHAPNYKKLRESNPDVKRMTITDEGNIWSFGMIAVSDESNPAWLGPVMRKDLLEKFGCEAPTTIDEWDNVLHIFKNNGVEIPLLMDFKWRYEISHCFISAYDLGAEFINVNGTVKYSPYEERYKDFIGLMARWYKEGLLDPDFATRDDKSRNSVITNGKVGAFPEAYGMLKRHIGAARTINSDFDLMGIEYPSLEKDAKLYLKQKNNIVTGNGAAITTSCKNPEKAVEWFDYGYSKEGFLLLNCGFEGEHYDLADGKPVIKQEILDNYNDYKWIIKPHGGPFLRDARLHAVFSDMVLDCVEKWEKAGGDYVMPAIQLTAEESKRYSALMTEIKTYVEEMRLRFILGEESLDNYEKYIKQLKKMGIEEAVEIQQKALDRFLNR